jgi:predicted transcriptional regulator
METLWSKGPYSIREVLEAFPENERLAYTTVQTVVYRLEKKAVRRNGKFSNAHVFEAVVSRTSAQHRMIDDLAALFGGRRLPIVTHLIESGKLTREAPAARWSPFVALGLVRYKGGPSSVLVPVIPLADRLSEISLPSLHHEQNQGSYTREPPEPFKKLLRLKPQS